MLRVPFLKVMPEQAVTALQAQMLAGYKLKDTIVNEYENSAHNTMVELEAAMNWEALYQTWVDETLTMLHATYESALYAYHVRDAIEVGNQVAGAAVVAARLVTNIQSQINKLNEFELFIREHLALHLTAGRDMFIINGNAQVKTKA